MTDPHERIGRYASRTTAFAAVLLVAATATASTQPHGGGAGGGMDDWGTFGGWMSLWPIVLLGLLALLIVWAGSRRRGDRIDCTDRADRPDHAFEELRERYARGEISEDEFERRRRNLQPYTND